MPSGISKNPERTREKKSNSMKEAWKRPGHRENISKKVSKTLMGHKISKESIEKGKKTCRERGVYKRASEKMKDRMKDPEFLKLLPDRSKTTKIRNCLFCEKEFKVIKCRLEIAKFCSNECQYEYKRSKRIKIFCECCGVSFTTHFKRSKVARFCSNKCAKRKLVTPKKDTSIEVKIQDFLKQLGIEFFTHQYINIKHAYQCDIFVPSKNLIIECDGEFFHMNPEKYASDYRIFGNGMTAKERWELDDLRTKELLEKGYKVWRIWENDIKKMNLVDFEKNLTTKIL